MTKRTTSQFAQPALFPCGCGPDSPLKVAIELPDGSYVCGHGSRWVLFWKKTSLGEYRIGDAEALEGGSGEGFKGRLGEAKAPGRKDGKSGRLLTAARAKEVRRLCKNGWPQKKVAKKYKVHPSTVSRIACGETYKNRGHGRPALTFGQMSKIARLLRVTDLGQREIAKKFGVSQAVISRIKRGVYVPVEKSKHRRRSK